VEYLKVGQLKKAFGVNGYIRFVIDRGYESDLIEASVWFCEIANSKVPFFVEGIKQKPSPMIKFEEMNGPEDARRITGSTVYLRQKDVTYADTAKHDDDGMLKFVGYDITLEDDTSVGRIVRIEEYPQQLMAVVLIEDDETLIPLVPDFIIDINIDERRIIMDLPEGLI